MAKIPPCPFHRVGDSLNAGPDFVMMFGKYRGMLVAQVLEENPEYLVWAHQNVDFFKLHTEVLTRALECAVLARRARNQAVRDQFRAEVRRATRVDIGGSHPSDVDLERLVRQQMSGSFGVHMNDLDLFVEGDWRDAEWDEDHWSNMRPY